MIHLSVSASCDFCQDIIQTGVQHCLAGDAPMLDLSALPVVFGKHACRDCLRAARDAVEGAFPRKDDPVMISHGS